MAPAPSAETGRSARTPTLWLAAGAAALALYLLTMDPGVQWQDSGWQQYRIVTGQLEHRLGLALTHPLQFWIGRLFVSALPVEPACAITLVSALCGAIAVANVAGAIRVALRAARDVHTATTTAAAFIAAAALMLSHTFWHHATHTESYALTAALLTGEWLCLAQLAASRRVSWLLAMALLNGLGVANHLLASLATPVDCVVAWSVLRGRRRGVRTALLALGVWLLGAAPYLTLVVRTMVTSGDAWATLGSALVGRFGSDVTNVGVTARGLAFSLAFVVYNFPGLTLPLALLGLARHGRDERTLVRAVAAEAIIFALFVVRYSVRDQYMFFFPVYAALALLAGIGLTRVRLRRSGSRRLLLGAAALTALWTPLLYVAASEILRARGLLAGMVGNKPYRDGYAAMFQPWGRGLHHAAALNREAYELSGAGGVILCEDEMVRYALLYEQAVGRARAARIVALGLEPHEQPVADAVRERRSVVLVPLDRDRPATEIPGGVWERRGDIYVLLPPASNLSAQGAAATEPTTLPATTDQIDND
ncbi:MAG: hypothetical protein CHACPFDD_02755 [Phycisphaerae bacterium]|nr:hypothetical protein [Phycisphaerae bacterium]